MGGVEGNRKERPVFGPGVGCWPSGGRGRRLGHQQCLWWADPAAHPQVGCDIIVSQLLSPSRGPHAGWVSRRPRDWRLSKMLSVVCILLMPICQGDQPRSSPGAQSPWPPERVPRRRLAPLARCPRIPFCLVTAHLHSACLSADH